MITLIPGDFIKFKDKLYQIHQDRNGNPIFQRIYLNSADAFEDSKIALEDTIKKVNISVSVPL